MTRPMPAHFPRIPVPALVVELDGRYVARAFHPDGTFTDSLPLTRVRAARIVAALAVRTVA